MAVSSQSSGMLGGARPDPRTIVRLNAIASVLAGTVMLIFAGPLAQRSGVAEQGLLAIAGAILLGYGVDGLGVAVGRHLRKAQVLLYAFADAAWLVVGGAFVVVGPDALTFLERALIAFSAAVLGWFGLAALRAARSL